ncbi:hypothetical protein [Variovorax boronicumulans]|uniref:hypothetical protein n=1 Tax=Variovorax boronicumulans TaxID=436515 RepID=UPI0012E63371|nr:hypothetical protein [Variovorax boronicumulans]GER16691.1 hypothetical protein VCH24_16970 [Variovorax boronicumulans]
MIGIDWGRDPDLTENEQIRFVIHPRDVHHYTRPDGSLPPEFIVQQRIPPTLPQPRTTIVTTKRTVADTRREARLLQNTYWENRAIAPATGSRGTTEMERQIYQAQVTVALCNRLDAIADQQAPLPGDSAPMPETWWDEVSNFDIQRWIKSDAWRKMKAAVEEGTVRIPDSTELRAALS